MTALEAKSTLGVSPEHTKGWRETFLGELCGGDLGTIQTGPFGSQLHASDYRLNGIPVINPTHLRLNAIDESQVPRISKDDADRLSRHYLREGDILISRRGDFSRYSYIGTKQSGWLCGTGCLLIRLRHPEVDNRFLAASMSLDTVQNYFKQAAVGSIMPNLNTNILSEMPLLLPPVQEQRAIVKLLHALQDVLKVRQRELILEQERKTALMEFLFTRGTRGEATKETEINEIPESWRVARLGSIVFVKGGKRLPKGASFSETVTGLPYIRVVDFWQGSVSTNELKYLAPEIQHSISRYTISRDDVYISIAGTIGLVGTIPAQLDGANLTENAAKLVIIDPTSLDKDYLALVLGSECGQRQIQTLTAKTTQPKLALMRIEQILVPKPSIAEQRDIAGILRACEKKLVCLDREIIHLDELYRALLDELMSRQLSALPLIEEHQAR